MNEYKPGDMAYFYNDGEIDKVKVLEDNSNKEWTKYKLKVLEVVRESPIAKSATVGDEFECTKNKEFSNCGNLWRLLDE